MGQWLSWTDAISLSAALNGQPADPAPRTTAPSGARAGAGAEEGECTRVRAALAKAIGDDSHDRARTTDKRRRHALAPASVPAAAPGESTDTPADFAPHRRHYLARQQAMEAGIGPLRDRLRATLAARSPAMARLAAVDAVMQQVLDARERSLLSSVPVVLERHFERLRQAAQALQGDAPDAWLDVFRKDTRDMLLAELDFRFQPVEGLLDALRTKQTGCHE